MSAGAFRTTSEGGDGFVVIAELAPGRDGSDPARAARALAAADELAMHPGIGALSITDGAGGHASLAPAVIAERYVARAKDVVVNVACRGRSRDDLERIGRTLAGRGLLNVLAISGDYPAAERSGEASRARFDMDSAALLSLFAGLDTSPPLFPGAVVNTHKRFEREQMPQYHKLELKIASGARFIMSQLGYDARKDDELLRYLRLRRLATPVVSSVYILSAAAARQFHAGRVPGCVVTYELLALVERKAAAPDQGRRFFLELAAQQVAIARGLGCRGVLIGGYRSADEVNRVLEIVETYAADDWRVFARAIRFGFPDGFHYFESDPATGLNRDALNAGYLASCTPEARRRARGLLPTSYHLSRAAHDAVFAAGAPAFPIGASFFRGVERAGLARPLHVLEQAIKAPLFGCQDCGDCSLAETAYLCPVSQCPKGERNGPCGGSHDGRCEVDDRECIWALAYERLKPYGEEAALASRTPVIADETLRHTSGWANTFLKRDHLSRRGKQPETT